MNLQRIATEDQSGSTEPAKFNLTDTGIPKPEGAAPTGTGPAMGDPNAQPGTLAGNVDQPSSAPAANLSGGSILEEAAKIDAGADAPATETASDATTTVENVELAKESFRDGVGKSIEEVKAEELAAEKERFAAAESSAAQDKVQRARNIGYLAGTTISPVNIKATLLLIGPLEFIESAIGAALELASIEKTRGNIVREVAFRDSARAWQEKIPAVIEACSLVQGTAGQ